MHTRANPSSARITPFWDRLPKFFLFPLAPANLLVLAGLSLLSLLAFVLPVPRPFDFAIVEFIIWLSAMRQGFSVMEMTSYGYIDAETQSTVLPNDSDRVNLPWKMVFIFIVWGALIETLMRFEGTIGWLAQLALMIATPAIIMRLSATSSLWASFSPGHWLQYIRAIGMPYLLLCFFLLLLYAGIPVALTMFFGVAAGFFVVPGTNFIFLYFNLIMFYMMGYVMYQYHEPLGIAAITHYETGDDTEKREDTPDAKVAARLGAGDMEGAIAIARGELHDQPGSIQAHQRLYRLLLKAGNTEQAARLRPDLFEVCLRQGNADAAGLYKELTAADPRFGLQASQILPLARIAAKAHDNNLAIELIRGFDKKFPGHADIPAIYLFTAQLLSERFRNNDLARGVLQGMLKRHPQHALADEARQYLKVLEGISA